MHIDIDEIAKEFGATTALHPVSLSIPSGAPCGVIISKGASSSCWLGGMPCSRAVT